MAEASKVVSKGYPLQRGSTETQPVRPRRKAKKEAKPEANVMDVDYADDQALMDGTKAGLQETTDLLGKFCEYSGLYINVDKTKSMAVDRSCSQQPFTEASTLSIKVYGEESTEHQGLWGGVNEMIPWVQATQSAEESYPSTSK